jgi:hypothetical protein
MENQMQSKRCLILGSGNSLQEGIEGGLSSILNNEISFSINDNVKFFNSTAFIFGDWCAYRDRFYIYKTKEIVIGRYDSHFIHDIDGALKCPKQDGLILLKSSGKWNGDEGLTKGLYSSVLTGAFTLNLAIRLGFTSICLLGFDNCEINGRTHFYQDIPNAGLFSDYEGKETCGVGKNERGEYKTSFYNKDDCQLNLLWEPFKTELDNVQILNVSPLSRITVFPKINYQEFFRTINETPSLDGSESSQNEVRKEIRAILKPFNQVK